MMVLKFSLARALTTCLLGLTLLLSHAAHAMTCSVASNGFSSAYVPSTAASNVNAASFTVTCMRTFFLDATSQTFTVKVDNGMYRMGQNNRAASGGNRIKYDSYTEGACSTQWRNNITLGGTITFGSTNDYSAQSQTVSFWGCIPGSQTTVPAGTYTDTVTMTLTYGLGTATGTFGVSIVTPSFCSVTGAPSNLVFNYVSFQAANSSATSNFTLNCTNLLPYTMALDLTASTLLHINYSLSLSATSSVGTGLGQNYSINGSALAGQSGDCTSGACSANEVRTLTISY